MLWIELHLTEEADQELVSEVFHVELRTSSEEQLIACGSQFDFSSIWVECVTLVRWTVEVVMDQSAVIVEDVVEAQATSVVRDLDSLSALEGVAKFVEEDRRQHVHGWDRLIATS